MEGYGPLLHSGQFASRGYHSYNNKNHGTYGGRLGNSGGSYGSNNHFSRGNNNNSSYGSRNRNNLRCQLCNKPRHTALECWHKNEILATTSAPQQQQSHSGPSQQQFISQPSQQFSQVPQQVAYPSAPQYSSMSHKSGPPPPYMTSQSKAAPTAFHGAVVNQPQGGNSNFGDFNSTSWLLDSGASNHMTNDVSNLTNPAPYRGSDQVMVGNGVTIPIHNSGLMSKGVDI